jgi:hypothetical protein
MATVRLHGLALIPAPHQWIGGLACWLLGCGWLWATLVLASPADEVIPIGSITITPMANNRRAVTLKGKAKTVEVYEGQDNFGHALCGQGFILADDTGSLDVLYLIRCQATEPPALVREDERVVVHATIDVASDKIMNGEGRELMLWGIHFALVHPQCNGWAGL